MTVAGGSRFVWPKYVLVRWSILRTAVSMWMLPPVLRITELRVGNAILGSLTIFGVMVLDIHGVDKWLYQARPFSRALMHVRLTID